MFFKIELTKIFPLVILTVSAVVLCSLDPQIAECKDSFSVTGYDYFPDDPGCHSQNQAYANARFMAQKLADLKCGKQVAVRVSKYQEKPLGNDCSWIGYSLVAVRASFVCSPSMESSSRNSLDEFCQQCRKKFKWDCIQECDY